LKLGGKAIQRCQRFWFVKAKQIEKLEVNGNMIYELVLGLARSACMHGEPSYSLVTPPKVSIGSI